MIATVAKVRIRCDDSLEGVAQKLQAALLLPPFWFDSDMDPPHAITAMNECLGHELWLRAAGTAFELTVEASVNIEVRAAGNLVNVSEWLAKHIGIVSDLECSPAHVFAA